MILFSTEKIVGMCIGLLVDKWLNRQLSGMNGQQAHVFTLGYQAGSTFYYFSDLIIPPIAKIVEGAVIGTRKLIVFPFYYMSGAYAADQRLKALKLAEANLAMTRTMLQNVFEEQSSTVGGIIIRSSAPCIKQFCEFVTSPGFTNKDARAKLLSSRFNNPYPVPFLSFVKFVDVYGQPYRIIILNREAYLCLVCLIFVVVMVSGLFLFVIVSGKVRRYYSQFEKK